MWRIFCESRPSLLWVWSRSPHQVGALCCGARGVARLQDYDDAPPWTPCSTWLGASTADRPWTQARRELLWRSRVDQTRTLLGGMGSQPTPPSVQL